MPEILYDMEIDDLRIMIRGFEKRLEYEESLFKRLAYITHASMVSKPLSPERLWPARGKKKLTGEEIKKRSELMMERINLMEKIDKEKRKLNGGRVKGSN
jgi:hypothetical protein